MKKPILIGISIRERARETLRDISNKTGLKLYAIVEKLADDELRRLNIDPSTLKPRKVSK